MLPIVVASKTGLAASSSLSWPINGHTDGIGHPLMRALFACAKSQGIARMFGRVPGSNRDRIEFVQGWGFEVSDSPEGPWLKIASTTL